jgi:mono/diheme cytochrome c family protein
MIMRRVGIAVVAAALLPFTVAFTSGGWWVHTVENLPEYFVVGEPVEMSISLRQHGMTLMPNLSVMEVQLTGPNSASQTLKVTPTARPGYYTANVVVSEPGEWSVAVQSGHMRLELLPMKAIAAGDTPPARLTAVERGRQLYAAKGCVTCHGSSAAPAAQHGIIGGITQVNVAPELIGTPFRRGYIEEVLANPGQRMMPNLNLSRDEIGAIAAFLHSDS